MTMLLFDVGAFLSSYLVAVYCAGLMTSYGHVFAAPETHASLLTVASVIGGAFVFAFLYFFYGFTMIHWLLLYYALSLLLFVFLPVHLLKAKAFMPISFAATLGLSLFVASCAAKVSSWDEVMQKTGDARVTTLAILAAGAALGPVHWLKRLIIQILVKDSLHHEAV